LPVRRSQEATRALTMLALVSAGLGATLLPASIRRVPYQGVRYAERPARSYRRCRWP